MVEAGTLVRGALARAGVRPSPIAVAFEVTHLCNLACHYCDRHTQGPAEMTLEQILTVLDDLYRLGMRYISLDGGEPLAHPDIDTIVGWLLARDVRVVMNTNGILVPRKIDTVRRLAKVKISLDGPEERHDRMRGKGAYRRALRGAEAARRAGVAVELTCVIGSHNVDTVGVLLDHLEEVGFPIVFQPARNSLFVDSDRDGSGWEAEVGAVRAAFRLVEARKHRRPDIVANGWASLRHFRRFPDDVKLPCAAGWTEVTLDPEGNVFHCGQLRREPLNVVALGVEEALRRLQRGGCTQCWCARVVDGNYRWGGRVAMLVKPLRRVR